MIKNLRRKGFTIVELVIVIAVIAILAAILIPTFSGIIKKANIANDTALAKNMNTALVMADSEGNKAENMRDVLFTLYEAGYVLENLNPTTNGYYFVWDQESNQILFLTDKFEVHYSSKPYSEIKLNWWMPVDEISDVIVGQEFSYCMAADIRGNIPEFTYLANFDTNGFILQGNLSYDSIDTGSFSVAGKIQGTLQVNTPNASVNHYGAVDYVNIINVAKASYHEYGFVKFTLELNKGRLVIENSGNANTVDLKVVAEDGSAENNGRIGNLSANAVAIDNKAYIGTATGTPPSGLAVGSIPAGYAILIENLTQLEAFRDAVNSGMRCADYNGTSGKAENQLTVRLTADIDMSNKYWVPIGLNNRDLDVFYNGNNGTEGPANVFMGKFDGNGKTINGLGNFGFFAPKPLFATNAAFVTGYHFGLFSVTYDAEIRNLKMTNVNIINDTTGLFCAGAISGVATGSFTLENCTVKGNIEALDCVGGTVGYVYNVDSAKYPYLSTNKIIKFDHVVVEANIRAKKVTSVDTTGTRAGGIFGALLTNSSIFGPDGTTKLSITNCSFTGNVKADLRRAGGLFSSSAGLTPSSTIAGSVAEFIVKNNTVKGDIETLTSVARFFPRGDTHSADPLVNNFPNTCSLYTNTHTDISGNVFTGKVLTAGVEKTTVWADIIN